MTIPTFFRPMIAMTMRLTMGFQSSSPTTSTREWQVEPEAEPLLASYAATNANHAAATNARYSYSVVHTPLDIAALAAIVPSPSAEQIMSWRMRCASSTSLDPMPVIDEDALIALDQAKEDRLLRKCVRQRQLLCFEEFDIDDEGDDDGDDADEHTVTEKDQDDDERNNIAGRDTDDRGDDGSEHDHNDENDGADERKDGDDRDGDASIDDENEDDHSDDEQAASDRGDGGATDGSEALLVLPSVFVEDAVSSSLPRGGHVENSDTRDDASEDVTGHHVFPVVSDLGAAVRQHDNHESAIPATSSTAPPMAILIGNSDAAGSSSTPSMTGSRSDKSTPSPLTSTVMFGSGSSTPLASRASKRYASIKAKVNSNNNSKTTTKPRRPSYATKTAVIKEQLRQQNRDQRRRIAHVTPKVRSFNHILVQRESPTHFEKMFRWMQSMLRHKNRLACERLSQVRATMRTQPTVSPLSSSEASNAVSARVGQLLAREAEQQRENAVFRRRLGQVRAVTNSFNHSTRSRSVPSTAETVSTSATSARSAPRSTPSLRDPSIHAANAELRERLKRVQAVTNSHNYSPSRSNVMSATPSSTTPRPTTLLHDPSITAANVELRARLHRVVAVTNSHRMVAPRTAGYMQCAETRVRSTPSLYDEAIQRANAVLRSRLQHVQARTQSFRS